MGLPAEIFKFEAAIHQREHESEDRPHRSQSPIRGLMPREEGQQSGRGASVQVSNRVSGLVVRGGRFSREEVKACGHDGNCDQPERNALPERLLEFEVENVGAQHSPASRVAGNESGA
jgi:hypothetical protein